MIKIDTCNFLESEIHSLKLIEVIKVGDTTYNKVYEEGIIFCNNEDEEINRGT